ncbi:hypothetical protein OROMI_016001 [Orobanche minor]
MDFANYFDLNFSPSSEERLENPAETNTHVVEEDESLRDQEDIARNFDLNEPPLSSNNDMENDWSDEGSHYGQEGTIRVIDLNQDPPNDSSEEVESESEPVRKRVKMLTNEERRIIYLALLSKSVDGKLRKGTTRDISQKFSVSTRTITRIWTQSKNTINGVVDVSHRKTKNCGRKRVEIDYEKFREIPLSQRTCIRSIACAMNVSKSTVHRYRKSGKIRRHSNPVKPLLKESNKRARVQFCLSMLDQSSIPQNPVFEGMYNVIHIDEKWFYISRKTEKYYLLPEECDPERSCKSKNFLTKIMFLAAMARPRFDSMGNVTFSEKIGIFPFVSEQPAKRNSVNRAAGTLEIKPMTSVGKDTCRSFLIGKVLPAILEKWPDRNTPIRIQQDNARTHIDPNDEEFRAAVSRLGLNIQLTCQPPNSPDLNVLDLGFFAAIQSLQYKIASKTVEDLIDAVKKAFHMFPCSKGNHIFLTLQECMIEIMKVRGSNTYKIPHMNKSSLEKNKMLPCNMKCDPQLVEEVIAWLNTHQDV